jgi:hypothetical protein
MGISWWCDDGCGRAFGGNVDNDASNPEQRLHLLARDPYRKLERETVKCREKVVSGAVA